MASVSSGPIRPPLRSIKESPAVPAASSRGGFISNHADHSGDAIISARNRHTVQPPKTSTIVEQVERHFSRFLAIDPQLPLVLSLWSLATHVYDCFDAFPYLAITSPTKRCGKTRTAEVLELFSARPWRTVNATPAVLFRSIDRDSPSLMIDEAEVLRTRDERGSVLLEILNAGYRKGQMVRRCESKNYDLREFNVYCPKVIVLIGEPEDTLADRSIAIRMRRRFQGEKIDRFILAKAKRETAPTSNACEKWAETHKTDVADLYEDMDLPFLVDREAELWLPLFTVCAVAAPHRYAELEETAWQLGHHRAGDEPADSGIRLLSDIRTILRDGGREFIPTSDLLQKLNAIDDAPWSEHCRGKHLHSRALAAILRPFGVQSGNHRFGESVVKGYLRGSFAEVFERYLG